MRWERRILRDDKQASRAVRMNQTVYFLTSPEDRMRITPAARSSARGHRRRGFTLVELLVVIGIIAVLVAILLPSLNKVRDSAKKTACLANLRSIGQLIQMYAIQAK